MTEPLAVGVDFGGTKILAGIVNFKTGQVIGKAKKKTRQINEHEDVVKRITQVIDEALADAGISSKQLAGIGVGALGQIDRDNGVILYTANIGTTNLSITEPLSKQYGVECYLGNDLEAATLGELHFGAGRNCDNFVCVFVGTGIGSGIVESGKIYRGATGCAGEFGHTIIDPTGRLCKCGSNGCLEAYASRTAIAKTIVAELKQGTESMIRDKIDMSKAVFLKSSALTESFDAGDDLVTRVVTQAAEFLGIGLANIINFYNPQKIILGGGLVEAIDAYFHIASKVAKQKALKISAENVEIVKAELADYAGVVGAALMVKNRSRV